MLKPGDFLVDVEGYDLGDEGAYVIEVDGDDVTFVIVQSGDQHTVDATEVAIAEEDTPPAEDVVEERYDPRVPMPLPGKRPRNLPLYYGPRDRNMPSSVTDSIWRPIDYGDRWQNRYYNVRRDGEHSFEGNTMTPTQKVKYYTRKLREAKMMLADLPTVEQQEELLGPETINDHRDELIGGEWILGPGAVVAKATDVTIIRMEGDAFVENLEGRSLVEEMYDSSQVGEMLGSSQVGKMWGSSQVGKMWDSSQVGEMWDSSQVGEMWDNSQVGKMMGSSQVGEMWDNSQVEVMYDSSQVGVMYGNPQVGKMWGSSQVGKMWDSSQVGTMYGNSQVGTMYGSSMVGVMLGSSKVGEMYDSSQVGTMYERARLPEGKEPLEDKR